MESPEIMSGIPKDYILVHYHKFQHIKRAVGQVFAALNTNDGSNQFVLVLGLPEKIRTRAV